MRTQWVAAYLILNSISFDADSSHPRVTTNDFVNPNSFSLQIRAPGNNSRNSLAVSSRIPHHDSFRCPSI
jgi:hypothetical protein